MDFFHSNKLNVKQEVHHIAIFNNVIFPFRTHLACFFRALLTLVGDEVLKGQMIAEPAKGLSVGIHASVNGLVSEVNEKYVVIETQEGRADNE